MKTLVAKWEAKGRKRFLELFRDEMGYSYRGEDCGGNLGAYPNDLLAIHNFEASRVKWLALDFPSTKRVY